MFRLLWSVAVLSLVVGDQLLFASGALSSGLGGRVVCPNKQFTCPDGNTCCEQATPGTYGCCPLLKAVCCPDKQHCCPSGTTCGSGGTCNMNGQFFPAQPNRPATPQPSTAGKNPPIAKQQVKKPLVQTGQNPPVGVPKDLVVCPDRKSSCISGSTCCALSTGQWACCPLPQAMCCSDGIHCCPVNSTCDIAQKRCERAVGAPLPWFSKLPARPVTGGDVVCPGGKFSCPSGSTCCKLSTGMWGCCPLPSAVCCSDGRHCCPKNYKCDVKHGTCIKEDNSINLFWQEIADLRGKPAFEIATICPGSKFKCGKSHKCCAQVTPEGEDRKFECCPFPAGVCCNDHKHCCPKGYQCDLRHLKCMKEGAVSIPIGVNKESFPTDPFYKPKLKRRKTVMSRIKDAFGKLGQALKNHLLEDEDPDDPGKTTVQSKDKKLGEAKAKAAAKGKPLPKAAQPKASSKLSVKAKAAKVSAKSKFAGKVPTKPLPKLGKTATSPGKTMPSTLSQSQKAKAMAAAGKASAKMTIAAKSKLKLAAGKLAAQQRAAVPKTMATAKIKANPKAKVVSTKTKVVPPKIKVSPTPSKIAKAASHSQHRPAQKVVSKQLPPKAVKMQKQNPVPKVKQSAFARDPVIPKQKVLLKSKVLPKPKPTMPLPKYKDPGGASRNLPNVKIISSVRHKVPPKRKTILVAKAKQGAVPKKIFKPVPTPKAKAKLKTVSQVKAKAKPQGPVSKSRVVPKQVKKAPVKPKQVFSKLKTPLKSKSTVPQKVKITPKSKVFPKAVPKGFPAKKKKVPTATLR